MRAFTFTRPRKSGLWKALKWKVRAAMSPHDGIDRALAEIFRQTWNAKTMRIVFPRMENPETAEIGRLLFGVAIARYGNLDSACHAFSRLPDETLTRYALPEAAAVLAKSNPKRVQSLLRSGRERWTQIGFRLSRNRCFSLATTSAYLGDAEGVEFFTTDLRHSGIDALKRRFAVQKRTARHFGVKTDYISVRNAALSVRSPSKVGCTKLIEALEPDFPLAMAAEGPVWLQVQGNFGKVAYPSWLEKGARRQGFVDFPFPGNVRPLFLKFHIVDPEILNDASLAYLRRFAPIGCRDLFTARLLRGAGVEAFTGESELPQAVLAAVLNGQSEAKIRALWRKAVAPAMARTDALITKVNAKYPLPKVRLAELRLDRVLVRSFGPKGDTKADNDTVLLLFNFDDNQAQFFPGTFEGIWRHATRPLVVHVFGRGLTATMFENWVTLFPGVRFIWRDLSGFAFDDVCLKSFITVSTMDRLLAPELLPDVEKIVYLDLDILVKKDISALYDTQLGKDQIAVHGRGYGATILYSYTGHGRHAEEKQEIFRNAFFSGQTDFRDFNAGVLVMNLAAMRRDRVVEKSLALVRACGVDDQIALNLSTRGFLSQFGQEWNIFPNSRVSNDPAIIHFVGPVKPWSTDLPEPYAKEWRENARRVASRLTSATRRPPWIIALCKGASR